MQIIEMFCYISVEGFEQRALQSRFVRLSVVNFHPFFRLTSSKNSEQILISLTGKKCPSPSWASKFFPD